MTSSNNIAYVRTRVWGKLAHREWDGRGERGWRLRSVSDLNKPLESLYFINDESSKTMWRVSFLKRSLSFTDVSAAGASSNAVPKGFLAVDIGEDMKRFVIPTSYLSHQAFSVLLREAEEEFGFQQEGVLRIPCEADVFQNILKVVEAKNSPHSKQTTHLSRNDVILCGSLESQSISQSHHPASPMCR